MGIPKPRKTVLILRRGPDPDAIQYGCQDLQKSRSTSNLDVHFKNIYRKFEIQLVMFMIRKQKFEITQKKAKTFFICITIWMILMSEMVSEIIKAQH